MAGLIKKQILKHLSKFAKNLSADKINLSTLRGEGELSNLELDCIALQNVMNLPTWLQISHATCNRVYVKIPWTKLKTLPICIVLDAVDVEMNTCETPRPPNGPSPIQASASSGDTSYGFTEKVLEGMTVNINSISVNFKSQAFNATFQLSQLSVFSTNPQGQKSDLKSSRITDKILGQVLTFKKLSWQTMRIVADALTTNEKNQTTPLRLITNQSEITMTFRRKISDCSVLASRLHIHFDDLLWVLTDSQVQSALLCVKSLRDTIERSSQQMRNVHDAQAHTAPPPPKSKPADASNLDDQSASIHFDKHTVIETAIHLDFDRVDLHVCEESSPVHRASKKSSQGGAIQISLHDLKIDNYPYHKAASDREHFRDYGEVMKERNSWSDGIIKQFRADFSRLKKASDNVGNMKTPTSDRKPAKLVENCLSVRLSDIDIHQVTTQNSKNQNSGRLINSTRKELHLPPDMPLFHFMLTEYYYPDGRDYPAPHDNIFMQINAPQLHMHWDSLVWLHTLTITTVQAVQKMLEDLGILFDDGEEEAVSDSSDEHTDIRIQVLMPKIFIPGPTSTHSKQPHGLLIQASKCAITNCREGIDCARIQLKNILNQMNQQYILRNPNSFPCDKEIDLPHMQDMFAIHASNDDNPLDLTIKSGNPTMTKSSLRSPASKDVWSVDVEQLWIDFILPSQNKMQEKDTEQKGGFLHLPKNNDPVTTGSRAPFLDSFPVKLWICKSSTVNDGASKLASRNLPALIRGPVLSPTSSLYNVASPSYEESSDVNKMNVETTDLTKVNGHAHDKEFDSATDSQCTKQSLISHSQSSTSIDSFDTSKTASPRSSRNQKLLDFYRSTKEDDSSAHDRTSISSSSSTKNKVISTHILVYTNEPVRLQLDHHQYLYLLRLIDKVEEVGKILDSDSDLIMSSTPSSASSTPSLNAKTISEAQNRMLRRKSKPVSTTSVRISAPTADLFLILRPPPPNVRKGVPSGDGMSSTQSCSASVKSEPSVSDENISTPKKAPIKLPISVQDTPPLSECGSDTVSVQGSDIVSIFGDSITTPATGVYPHFDNTTANSHTPNSSIADISICSYPHESSDTEDLPLLPKDNSLTPASANRTMSFVESPLAKDDLKSTLSKAKSGSLSILPSNTNVEMSSELKSQVQEKLQIRNHSSDNLKTVVSTSDQNLNLKSASAAKSSSSGYESGSYDSLPLQSTSSTVNKKTSSNHSHSSSDASNEFVMIQVDEKGRGTNEFASFRVSKTSASSSVRSETSSIASSQGISQFDQNSKSDPDQDSLSAACGLVDSQITVTNVDSGSLASNDIDTDKNHDEKANDAIINEEKKEEPDMSSLVHLHVSEGVELAIDSNDVNDSVVKIVASMVDVGELGVLRSDKTDSIFVNYTPKKCSSMREKKSASMSNAKSPNFCLRVDSGPLADRFSAAAAKVGHIQISANSVPLNLHSSTLANLGAFVEDEVIADIVPMKIEAAEVKLTIKDDMPPSYEATPPPEDITLHIHSASVTRTDDGTFHVTTSSSGSKSLLSSVSQSSSVCDINSSSAVANATSRENAVISTESAATPIASVNVDDNLEVSQNQILDAKNSENRISTESLVKEAGNSKSQHAGIKTSEISTQTEEFDSKSEVERLKKRVEEITSERDAFAKMLDYMQEDLITLQEERANFRAKP